ncbi:MAG TPA: peptidase M1, partial [Chitinophagaceae bacterium]|nr:peptidase M1 [Chitinophagaceae bacterium]
PDASAVAVLEKLALQDPQRIVRAQAIDALAKLKNPAYADMFKKAAQDSSYSVAGAGLVALLDVDSAAAVNLAKQLGKSPAKGRLASAITDISIKSGDESAFES